MSSNGTCLLICSWSSKCHSLRHLLRFHLWVWLSLGLALLLSLAESVRLSLCFYGPQWFISFGVQIILVQMSLWGFDNQNRNLNPKEDDKHLNDASLRPKDHSLKYYNNRQSLRLTSHHYHVAVWNLRSLHLPTASACTHNAELLSRYISCNNLKVPW